MLSEGKFFQEMQSILIWLEHKRSLRNANQLGKNLQKNILYRSFVLDMGETGIFHDEVSTIFPKQGSV